MSEGRSERRLAAILVADVVGYSRLMEADEAGTLAALNGRRKGIIEPLVREHSGRIVKFMGDGVLVEFASAVNAAGCAIAVQKKMAEANEGLPEARRILLRIGLNLGDVIGEGDDIYGDGVNVAARLEAMAEVGGVCLSGKIWDEVSGKLDIGADDLGEVRLKNIGRPVRAYRVAGGGAGSGHPAPGHARVLPLPDKPSIAVLPFQNMSGDAEQDYFSDGLTADIITDLSNVRNLLVIARNSSFAYKGRSTDVRQISRELGVKYLLEGSVRRSSQRLRVNVQLIDAAGSGTHVFAERFDRELSDIFEVQDDITRRVVETVSGRLGPAQTVERYRPTSLLAYDLCMRFRYTYMDSEAEALAARAALERAVSLDPHYAEAHYELASAHLFLWLHFGHDRAVCQAAAVAFARKAVDLDPNDARAHSVLGYILVQDRQWDTAARELEQSMVLNPNDADCIAAYSDYKIRIGEPGAAADLMCRAFRLNPNAPSWYYWNLGEAQIELGQYEDAVKTLDRPEIRRSIARRHLAAALALGGRRAEAEQEAAAYIAEYPDWTIGKWRANAASRNEDALEMLVKGYRLAGLPE